MLLRRAKEKTQTQALAASRPDSNAQATPAANARETS